MRDRLIEILNEYDRTVDCDYCPKDQYNERCGNDCLADHLLANGVIVPPVKIGQTVYEIEKECLGCLHFSDGGYSDFCECTLDDNKLMFECDFDKECVYKIIPQKFIYGMIEHFGKTVFLTREDAEKALAERNNR